MQTNTKISFAKLSETVKAYLDNLDERLDNPQELERMMQNPIAYVCLAVAYSLPLLLIIDAFVNHRFAWWSFLFGAGFYALGKALYIPAESKHPKAEEVRAQLESRKSEMNNTTGEEAAASYEIHQ